MNITLPTDCGNAPRIGIVGDFIIAWASRNTQTISEWVTDATTWMQAGGASFSGEETLTGPAPPLTPEGIELFSIITHGRLASCDGVLERGEERIAFSFALRFNSTAKTAKIAEVRSYCIAAS